MQIKVLYIVGKGRSGSTLLDTMLGQFDRHAAVGEAWHYWDVADDPLHRCGCGLAMSDCPRWTAVRRRLSDAGADIEAARDAVRRATSWPTVVLAALLPWLVRRRMREYAAAEAALFSAIADEFEAEVIVDSSKWPTDPVLLGLVDNVEAFAVHLVRDPRGVAFSWQRLKQRVDREPRSEMPRHRPAQSAFSWLVRNALAEKVIRGLPDGHRTRIRYEDLVTEPASALTAVSGMTGVPVPVSLLAGPSRIRIEPTHTVAGNPDRVHGGSIPLAIDDAWKTELGFVGRAITTMITAPLLWRYGYRLRTRGRGPA